MKIIVFLLSLSMTACIQVKEEQTAFRAGRNKLSAKKIRLTPKANSLIVSKPADKQPSAPPTTGAQTLPEKIIPPFTLTPSHTVLFLKSDDYKKFNISVEPNTQPFNVVAGLSGTVSLRIENGTYYLSLTPNQGSKTLYYELSQTGTAVKTMDQAKVSQGQTLMTSLKPVVFYVKDRSDIQTLCFDIAHSDQTLTIKKELPNTDECS